MGFDPKVAEARLALNLIETTEMPKLAWDALEAGLDGPAIRRLAALEFPTFFQIRDSLPRVMEEMHLMKLGGGEAALHLAKMRAQEVLRSNAHVLRHVGDFHYFWVQADYCDELREYGILGEEAYNRWPVTWGKLRRRSAFGSLTSLRDWLPPDFWNPRAAAQLKIPEDAARPRQTRVPAPALPAPRCLRRTGGRSA
jgi:hypothetical protein